MKSVLILLIGIFPTIALAQQPLLRSASPVQTSTMQPRPVARVKQDRGPFMQVSLGLDVRGERAEDQVVKPQMMPNISASYIRQNWQYQLEYATRKSSTGNASLSVDRKFETAMGWVYWQVTDTKYFAPYLGGGIGVQRETIETKLLGASDTDTSGNYWAYGGSFGIRFFPKSPIWLTAEGRLYKSGHQDPDPQLGGLLRFGFAIR